MHAMVLLAGAALAAPLRAHPGRRLLPVDAAVPPQRGARRMVGGAELAARDGPGAVLGLAVPRRRPPLRRHLHELRRQAAGLHPGQPGTAPTTSTTRCGWRSATRPATAISRSSPDASAATVWDGFGSTENAVTVTREDGCPRRLHRQGLPRRGHLRLGDPRPSARSRAFDEHGALVNADEAIGELVNTEGAGMFAGYYNDQDATDERMRHGMFWSGDLAYRDADGWIYLAGPHRGLDAGGRREHDVGAHRADPDPANPRSARSRSTRCPTNTSGTR